MRASCSTDSTSTHSSTACAPAPRGPITTVSIPAAESSAAVAGRVRAARARQAKRYAGLPGERRIRINAEADGALLDEVATPEPAGRALLARAAERLRLSARGYHRVLRVARTLADLEGAPIVARRHVAEALSYRRMNTPSER